MTSICELHSINMVKTVRMRTAQIAPLLKEKGGTSVDIIGIDVMLCINPLLQI